ncbi:bifunctional heptose 7-phosphate kinase/heptose 1-phosphate adenyltransferase [Salmonirosea aquatica]|uniref:Carbohydrate kinase n=1 Tax=Salmonirosea aquatica TaxID=2654236 RepID=A0A7C9BHA2_9BACT|nr:carbohydrate kinase [Cytophagaceae bacterium SJW1-29]
MQESEVHYIFEKISSLRVGVIGDFAVDFYYDLQKKTGEISLETRREVWWGRQPRTSLGAAGNVVQNLAALGVGTLKVFGAVGRDVYGREMLHLMQKLGVDTAGIRIQDEGWETCAYTKPLHQGTELNRVDFGTHNLLSKEGFEKILKSLKAQMAHLDILIINQQFASPLITQERVELLNTLATVYPQVYILADMRTYGLALRGMTLKVNTEEMGRLLEVAGHESWTTDECTFYGHQLSDHVQGPVLITRGEQGMQYVHASGVHQSAALTLEGELDTVGAGDTSVAAFAACAGARVPVLETLALANLAAAVTVQKINQTGTATRDEIIELIRTV